MAWVTWLVVKAENNSVSTRSPGGWAPRVTRGTEPAGREEEQCTLGTKLRVGDGSGGLVRCLGCLGFPDFDLPDWKIESLRHVEEQLRDILCGRIYVQFAEALARILQRCRERVVFAEQRSVVEVLGDPFAYRLLEAIEVNYHPVFVKRLFPQYKGNSGGMAVQVPAPACIVHKPVSVTEGKCLGDGIHVSPQTQRL